jgi:hypothetical protein
MNRLCTIVASCILLPSFAVADDAGRAVVEKAIKAHGGPEKVAKLRVMRVKAEGTITLAPGQPGLPIVIEDWWQMPDQYKTTSRFELDKKKVSQTQTIDGGTGWIQGAGQVTDMPKDALTEMRKQKFAEDADRLGFLGDKDVEVTALGEAKVGGRASVGVLVKAKDRREVKLYFDKESGRLVKREHTVFDGGTGKDVVQEVVFGDYRDRDGVPHYHTFTASRGGKKFVDLKIVEIEFFDKLDKKVFAKP